MTTGRVAFDRGGPRFSYNHRMPEPVRKGLWNEIKWVTWGAAMVVLIAAAVIFVLLDG